MRTPALRIEAWIRPLLDAGSGPGVARAFHALLAIVHLQAFASLGLQVDVLIGSRGLLPLATFVETLRNAPDLHAGAALARFPTLFLWVPGDLALGLGIWVGIALAGLALLGLAPRLCFALLGVLYLSYATACRDFLHFQWDNLLVECSLLAVFLPRDRPALWIHVLFRVLLVKLYWESGLAKYQSPLGDWLDGSAMSFYYETAPIPTALAWWAHHLPDAWHMLESRLTLILELGVALCAFGPRIARLATLAALTGFQSLNLLTANYAFFCYLALALHVFLLDDRDIERARALVPLRLRALRGEPSGQRSGAPPYPARRRRVAGAIGAGVFTSAYLALCLNEAVWSFAHAPGWRDATAGLRAVYAPFRAVNSYHLFGHVTRERIEPEFQSLGADGWRAHALRYKPGPEGRRPPFVAPHQPRVDFRLWFHGLTWRRGTPAYVRTLLARLCSDPQAVQSLFEEPLRRQPHATRITYWRYRFTSPEEGRGSGAWWRREWVGATRPLDCRR